jgi:hypothetical protein
MQTLKFRSRQKLQFGSLAGFRNVTVLGPEFVATCVAALGLSYRGEAAKFVGAKCNLI